LVRFRYTTTKKKNLLGSSRPSNKNGSHTGFSLRGNPLAEKWPRQANPFGFLGSLWPEARFGFFELLFPGGTIPRLGKGGEPVLVFSHCLPLCVPKTSILGLKNAGCGLQIRFGFLCCFCLPFVPPDCGSAANQTPRPTFCPKKT